MCTTLALCWINALNEGLRGGDIGNIMEPAIMHEDLFQYAYFVVYQLSFFAIVITVLLNVIFGIIVDTFAELRSAHAAKKDNMEKCAAPSPHTAPGCVPCLTGACGERQTARSTRSTTHG